MANVGMAMRKARPLEFTGNRARKDYRGERLVTTADALRERYQVRTYVKMPVREELSGAATATHDLVGDQQDIVCRTDLPNALEVAWRRGHDAERRADNRLRDECRDLVAAAETRRRPGLPLADNAPSVLP